MTDVTIIIVNWNSKEFLKGCLVSLMSDSIWERARVVVVDNASSDGSQEMVTLDFPEVEVIQSGANLGFAKANNLAVASAETPYILFLNPDTEVLPGAIDRTLRVMEENEEYGLIGCKMMFVDGEVHPLGIQWFPNPLNALFELLFVTAVTRKYLWRLLPEHDPMLSGEVRKLYGGYFLTRKAVLDQVGSFDERFFMWAEDVDLSRRIRDAGWKLYYDAEATIIHHVGGSAKKGATNFHTLMKCESHHKLMVKYYGAVGGVLYKGAIMIGSLIRLFVVFSINLFRKASNRKAPVDIRKYRSMILWVLGREKPVIKS